VGYRRQRMQTIVHRDQLSTLSEVSVFGDVASRGIKQGWSKRLQFFLD
jgi:hypothetical protein